MGNKVNAKEVAQKCGVPVLKQNSIVITSDTNIDSLDLDVDFPVVLKAVYGGGGKGIKVIESNKDLLSTIRLCLKEAESAFGDSKLLIEQYVSNARHVEVQILADYYGNIRCV